MMNRWISIFLMLLSMSLGAQDFQTQIYQAYLEGKMDRWKEVMDQMESLYTSGNGMGPLYRLTEVQYGYIGYCLGADKKKEAEKVLEEAERNIQRLAAGQPDNPRVFSLMGAFYGYRVNLHPLKAPFYGKKSEEANDKALALGPGEPQAWMEKANIEFYKPAIFGGSKERSVALYEKAAELFEASPGRTSQNWIYLNCLAGLGLACEETGRTEQAGKVYRKLLEMEPSFIWIRDDLYPAYLKKHSAN